MDKEIYTTSAPSSGGILLGLLNILEPLNITSDGGLKNPLNVHRFLEALKFAFGARSWVTDPAFVKDKKRFEEVYTKEWADGIREKITDVSGIVKSFSLPNWGPIFFWQNETHSADYYGLQYDTPIDHGTTHLSAVDKWGGAASVTSTVSSYPLPSTKNKGKI